MHRRTFLAATAAAGVSSLIRTKPAIAAAD